MAHHVDRNAAVGPWVGFLRTWYYLEGSAQGTGRSKKTKREAVALKKNGDEFRSFGPTMKSPQNIASAMPETGPKVEALHATPVHRLGQQSTARRTNLRQPLRRRCACSPLPEHGRQRRGCSTLHNALPGRPWGKQRNADEGNGDDENRADHSECLTPAFGGNADMSEPKRRVVAGDGRRGHLEESDCRAD